MWEGYVFNMAMTNATVKLQESPATTLHLVDVEGKSIAHADPDAAAPEFASVRSEIRTLPPVVEINIYNGA